MKTVIEMAQQTLSRDKLGFWAAGMGDLEDFAELVRADERKKWEDQTAVEIHEAILDEREACAKVCEEKHKDGRGHDAWGWTSKDYAEAIRERGQA